MWAKYAYQAGASKENVRADVVKILTGTTQVAALSSDCVKSNSLIISAADSPAGWLATGEDNAFIYEGASGNFQWRDVCFGNGLFLATGCAPAGGASTLLYSSSDGFTWTARNTLPNATWSRIEYNGNDAAPLFVAIAGNDGGVSTIAASSVDGLTWTARTLPANQTWGTLAYRSGASPLWLALPRATASAIGAISTDGLTWTQIALPGSTSYTGAIWNGSFFWVTTSSGLLYKFNGSTWTAVTLPVTQGLSDIAFGGGSLVILPHEAAWSKVALVSRNSGASWGMVELPNGLWRRIIFTGSSFVAISKSTGAIAFSVDGLVWVSKFMAAGYECHGLAAGKSVVCTAVYSSSGSNVMPVINFNSDNLKALNDDGTSYKYVNVDVTPSAVVIRAAESMGFHTLSNLCYLSDSMTRAQQLDLTVGGILFLGASARYLLALSYKPATLAYGSSGYGSFCGVVEFSRDDVWNTNYPPFAWLSSNDFAACYTPRMKNGIDTDAKGAQAFLSLQPYISMSKQILDVSGNIPLHASVDLRLSNTASFTYTVLGGVVLGELKRTTDSFSITGDETIINSKSFFVMSGGTSNATFRLLMPKF
jgi:hypothetical protein